MTDNAASRWTLGLLALAAFAPPPQAVAQAPEVRIAQMEIDIWPEYDEPRVLVIYSGVVDSAVAVPTPFTFVIPDSAQIHMAGALGAQGEHHHATFTSRPLGGGLTEVSYQLATRHFYMEYYYGSLTGSDRREFRYPIVSPYPIAALTVLVQHPRRAEQFRTAPAATDLMTDQDGFTYNRVTFDHIGPGRDTAVAVSYVKSDRAPSVARGDGSEPGGRGPMRGILIVGGLLLAGAIGFGVLANSRRKHSPPASSAGRAAQQPAGPPAGNPTGAYKYCTACGARLERADKFCSECGAAARARG